MMQLPPSLKRNGWTWQHAVGTIGLAAIAIVVCRQALGDIVHVAMKDEESSQVWLAPVVAVWLVWVRRARIRQVRPCHQWVGPVLVVIGYLLNTCGDRFLIQTFWHGGAIVMVVGAMITVLGADVLRRFLPAFIALGFLIPVPAMVRQQIALPLQMISADVTQHAFALLGMDIARSGNVLIINDTPVSIAEACNGLRMVFALTLVAFAFAFGTPLRGYVRALVLAASPVFAIAANVIRLIPTAWVYGAASRDVADTVHDLAGWIMLPVVFLGLMGIIALLRWALVPVSRYPLAYD